MTGEGMERPFHSRHGRAPSRPPIDAGGAGPVRVAAAAIYWIEIGAYGWPGQGPAMTVKGRGRRALSAAPLPLTAARGARSVRRRS